MYTIREAADRAGVTADVLRAWERRYGVVQPRRTARGYRLYDEGAIRRLRAMRSLIADGWTASAAAEAVRDLADADLPVEMVPGWQGPGPDEGEDLAGRFVGAAAAMDPTAVRAILDEMGARASFEAMVERYLFPSLRALGEAWQHGTVSVAAEHAASAAVGRWIGAAYEAAGGNRGDGPRILVGLPPGARHELGALAFATAARRAGLSALYIGPDLPVTDWVRAAQEGERMAVVIGVPTVDDAPAARGVLAALRHAVPGLLVLLGGDGARTIEQQSVLPGPLPDAVRELEFRLARAAGQRGGRGAGHRRGAGARVTRRNLDG